MVEIFCPKKEIKLKMAPFLKKMFIYFLTFISKFSEFQTEFQKVLSFHNFRFLPPPHLLHPFTEAKWQKEKKKRKGGEGSHSKMEHLYIF